MLRLGGVASSTYLVAFPAIKKHFQQHGLELDWVLGSCWIPGSWISRWHTTRLLSSSLP